MNKKELLNKYLKEYRKDINCRSLKIIGEGCMGVAYKNGNKVFKLTTDFHDFLLAREGLKRNYDFFAKVYSVDAVQYDSSYLYILEVEYCGETLREEYTPKDVDKIDNTFLCLYDEIFDVFTINYYYNKAIYFDEVKRRLIRYFDVETYNKFKSEIKYVYSTFKKLENLCRGKKLKYFDYHSSNVCFINDKIKVIDFGFSNNSEDVRQRNRLFKTFKVKTL